MTMAGETPITFVGNAVEDPELRFTPSGAAVAKFRVASTPRTYNKDTSTWVDGEATFLTVNVWRQQAEQVAESILKGMRVVVVGVLKSRTYDAKDGTKRTVFEIEAEDIAVSLKFATAKVTKAQRSGGQQSGQQPGGFGSQQRPAQGQPDPWASNAPQSAQGGGGWGAAPQQQAGGFSEEPPF
jgi:single-strand DNA-binding protein